MPPKKKKGSGKKKKSSGKLAKMTEEERIIYMEQQRLAEEEVKKKKEDMLQQYIREKILKEEKFSRFNLFKLNDQWRNIMREAKSKELKKDIEILSQTFERVVDRKDSVLKSLAKDLEESDEQFMMALRSHIQNMDYLISLQNERMDTLGNEYNMELEEIKHEFDSEEHYLCQQYERQIGDLEDVLVALERHFGEIELEARTEFQNTRDEIKNKNLEEKHALRVNLETKVQEIWDEFQRALKTYNETTEERKNHYENLKEKDEKSAAEIERQMKKLQRIGEQIAALKAGMNQNSKEFDERNRQLKEERERMLLHFQELKGQMNHMRDIQREHLTKMTLESHDSLKECKRLVEKAERILKLSENCRKLETEEEKVTPFYHSSLTPEEEEDVKLAFEETPQEDWVNVMHKYDHLETFWKRFNKVQLDRLALEKERAMLAQENQKLRSWLKQYLDGISVNDEILAQQNSLIVVNGRTNVNLAGSSMDPRVRAAPPVLLEAAHIVKHNTTSRH